MNWVTTLVEIPRKEFSQADAGTLLLMKVFSTYL
jgi:hypothetical protein